MCIHMQPYRLMSLSIVDKIASKNKMWRKTYAHDIVSTSHYKSWHSILFFFSVLYFNPFGLSEYFFVPHDAHGTFLFVSRIDVRCLSQLHAKCVWLAHADEPILALYSQSYSERNDQHHSVRIFIF